MKNMVHAHMKPHLCQVESHASATRFSIAPWHLGVLSGLFALFDVFLAETSSAHDEVRSWLLTVADIT